MNIFGTTLVLRVVFNLKTKPTPSSRLHSRQPKSQTRTLALSLHSCRPRRQSCPILLAQYNLAQDKIIYCWYVQRLRRGRAMQAEKERKKQLGMEACLASRANSSLKIC